MSNGSKTCFRFLFVFGRGSHIRSGQRSFTTRKRLVFCFCPSPLTCRQAAREAVACCVASSDCCMCLWRNLPDRHHQGYRCDQGGNLQQMPPLLYGQAKVGRRRRKSGQVQEKVRSAITHVERKRKLLPFFICSKGAHIRSGQRSFTTRQRLALCFCPSPLSCRLAREAVACCVASSDCCMCLWRNIPKW